LRSFERKLQGRLAQIATGEGKSKIIAALSAIKALQSETVDVITSSPILAKRDAGHNRKLFTALFGLNVSPHPGGQETQRRSQRPLPSRYCLRVIKRFSI
jgi:preprotein translocase subunit SecA